MISAAPSTPSLAASTPSSAGLGDGVTDWVVLSVWRAWRLGRCSGREKGILP